ncbi:MAG: alpha/beta fold hydrolase [Phycisphaeraceae bacterium]
MIHTQQSNQQTSPSQGLTGQLRQMSQWGAQPLFYRAWASSRNCRRALFLFHGEFGHSGRFVDFVETMALPDTAVFAWDAPGFGRSPAPGDAPHSFDRLVRDADQFIRLICRQHQLRVDHVSVLGVGAGATLAATWVHDFAPPLRAMVLLSPAFGYAGSSGLALARLGLRRSQKNGEPITVPTGTSADKLTRDPVEVRRYQQDKLIKRRTPVQFRMELDRAARRMIDDAGAIYCPTLMLTGAADRLMRRGPQDRFFQAVSSPRKKSQRRQGARHDLLHDHGRDQVTQQISEFIQQQYAEPLNGKALLEADRSGYTFEEYRRLRQPLPLISPRRWTYAGQKAALQSLRLVSRGVRVGWKEGFDSGRWSDYLYNDRSSGLSTLGRALDRMHLESSAWRGMRDQGVRLQKMVLQTALNLNSVNSPVRIVDIASGYGRYVLQAMVEIDADVAACALLRDIDIPALKTAGALAKQMNLSNVAVAEGDAFDEESLAKIQPAPTLMVAANLYELVAENEPVLRSLRGMRRAMTEGGYLIYTNQPGNHERVAKMARIWVNRERQPLVMRRRTQVEMDALVREAGFEKVDMQIDSEGRFSVSLARVKPR